MNTNLKSILKFILFLSLGLFLLCLLYNKLDVTYQKECLFKGIPSEDCSLLNRLLTDFKSVKILWIIIICIIFMISNWLRALRWNQLIEPLGYKPKLFNSIGTIMLGYFTNLAVPRIGEVVRAASMSKYEDIPAEKLFGTIVIDRILDVISLLLVVGLTFILSFNTFQAYFSAGDKLPGMSIVYVLIFAGFLGILFLYLVNKYVINGRSQNPILVKIRKLVLGFKDGILAIRAVKNVPLLILYSIGIWLMYYLMTYLCFFAFAPTSHLGPVAGLVVFVFGSLGIVLPSPGGMGSYQWLVSEALVIYGVDLIDAFSFSNIMFFAIQIFCNIAFGLLFYFMLPIYNGRRLLNRKKS